MLGECCESTIIKGIHCYSFRNAFPYENMEMFEKRVLTEYCRTISYPVPEKISFFISYPKSLFSCRSSATLKDGIRKH